MTINYDTILEQKLNQLNGTDTTGKTWTMDDLNAAISDAGLTTESWYDAYGADEGLDAYGSSINLPSGIDQNTILDWKANQLNTDKQGGHTDWTSDSAMSAIEDSGLSLEDWYNQYGQYENLDQYTEPPQPSEVFGLTLDDVLNMQVGSYSGLPEDYAQQILDLVLPRLEPSIQNYRSDIDASTLAATEAATQTGRQLIESTAKDTLNSLASRGIFSGDIVSDALSKALEGVATDASNTAFESASNAATLKSAEPSLLSSILNYGKTSESYNELAPWEALLSNYIKTM